MPRKQKKYHFIYKTTNLLNEKFYVGMHSTDNLEDGYTGSGKRLRYSIRKYGLENHKFKILEFLPSREELKKREAEIVNEEMLKHPLCMNLKFGGEGGWDHVNIDTEFLNNQVKLMNSVRAEKMKDPVFYEEFCNRCVSAQSKSEVRNRITAGRTFSGKSYNHCKIGSRQTDETKKKIGAKNSQLQLGSRNSQFGSCWICNDEEAKKIKKEELQTWLDQGWRKGRK